ncbi:MAG TPA: hypothetical protein VF384_20185 [Planctomycetota bacterium]
MRTTLLCVSLLAACNVDDHAPAPPMPTVPITSANAVLVARAAVGASLGLADVAGIAVAVITATPPEPTSTIPGSGGGEVVRTWDDRDENARVSTGDLFVLRFTGFGEDGLVLDGEMSFDSLVVDGDLVNGLSWLLDARLHFDDVAVDSAAGTTTLRGPLWCSREKRATVMTLDLEPAEGLAVDGGEVAAGTPFAYHDYVLDFTFAQYGAGAVASDVIGGLVEFETKVPFTGIQVLPDPSVGELEVRGASGSRLTIRAVDSVDVELLLDADGDGTAEQTIPLAWSQL